MGLDKALLKILGCPSCQGELVEYENELICKKCSKRYIIKDNIPVLLIE